MADGAILLDEQGRIVLVNRPASVPLGRPQAGGQELVAELPNLLAIELQAPLDLLLIGGAASEAALQRW